METVIGIFDTQEVYAKHLAHYINDCPNLGCYAVVFRDCKEMEQYCERKKLNYLLTDRQTEEEEQQLLPMLRNDGILYRLQEEPVTKGETRGRIRDLFRYQSAKELLKLFSAEVQQVEQGEKNWHVIVSLNSVLIAERFAWNYAKDKSEKGRVLLLPWIPFFGKEEGEEGRTPKLQEKSISELLYTFRQRKRLDKEDFSRLAIKNEIVYPNGAEYYSDLCQYNVQEMLELLESCQKEGGYSSIVLLFGYFPNGMEQLLDKCDTIQLLYSSTQSGERYKKEFFRQMKYAGQQKLLSKIQIIQEEEVQMDFDRN